MFHGESLAVRLNFRYGWRLCVNAICRWCGDRVDGVGSEPGGLGERGCDGRSGPHRLHERPGAEDLDHSFQIVGQNVKAHLRFDLFEGFHPEVGGAPIQAFIVPKGCSTVARRTRMIFGARSMRSCISSMTASCSHRVIRRSLLVVHWGLRAQAVQLA